jgi:hypothetical protein
MDKQKIKTLAIKFLIYLIIGFAAAFIYRQLKKLIE